jgi:hypothetical protein
MEALYILLDLVFLAIIGFGVYLWIAMLRQSH